MKVKVTETDPAEVVAGFAGRDTCRNCRHWMAHDRPRFPDDLGDYEDDASMLEVHVEYQGDCRRNAPTPADAATAEAAGIALLEGVWPLTHWLDSCSQHTRQTGDWFYRGVSELTLSVRGRKMLDNLGAHCLGEVALLTVDQMAGVKGSGPTCIAEVRTRMEDVTGRNWSLLQHEAKAQVNGHGR